MKILFACILISNVLALYQDEQWVPRRTIYRGGSQKPQFDSFHPEKCEQIGTDRKCPPILMTLGLGHSGTTILNYWLLGIKVQKAKRNASEGGVHTFELVNSVIGKETKFFDTYKRLTSREIQRNYVNLFKSFDKPTSNLQPQSQELQELPSSHQLSIDFTPGVGRCARSIVVENIYTSFPNMKFLVFLRDPVEWLYSATYCKSAKSFDTWARRHIGGPHGFPLSTCFAPVISSFFTRFNRSRFLFIPNHYMRQYPGDVLLDVIDFLGLQVLNEAEARARTNANQTEVGKDMPEYMKFHLGVSKANEKESIQNSTRQFVGERTCHCLEDLHTLLDLEKPLFSTFPCPAESPELKQQRKMAMKTSCRDWTRCRSR